MATLTVWKFDTAEGADQAVEKLKSLQTQQLVEILDAATVSWPEGRKKPITTQAYNLVGAGALGGSFWGLLFGLIFFIPFLGAAIGAAAGALSGYFSDYGIDNNFIKQIQNEVSEGTSALFVLTGQVTVDKVREAFQEQLSHVELLRSNLSNEQEIKLREDFGTV